MEAKLLSSLPAVVISAFLISFATVVLPSPITLAASRFAMARGTRSAATLLSVVTVIDVGVFGLLVFGFQPLLHRLGAIPYLIPACGVLLAIGGLAMLVAARHDTSHLLSQRAHRRVDREQAMHGPALAGVAVAVFNPGYWIWWTTAGMAFIHAARHWGRVGLTLLLGAFIGGVLSWYIPLLWALHHGRQLFSAQTNHRILVVLGLAMFGFGLYLLWRGVHGW